MKYPSMGGWEVLLFTALLTVAEVGLAQPQRGAELRRDGQKATAQELGASECTLFIEPHVDDREQSPMRVFFVTRVMEVTGFDVSWLGRALSSHLKGQPFGLLYVGSAMTPLTEGGYNPRMDFDGTCFVWPSPGSEIEAAVAWKNAETEVILSSVRNPDGAQLFRCEAPLPCGTTAYSVGLFSFQEGVERRRHFAILPLGECVCSSSREGLEAAVGSIGAWRRHREKVRERLSKSLQPGDCLWLHAERRASDASPKDSGCTGFLQVRGNRTIGRALVSGEIRVTPGAKRSAAEFVDWALRPLTFPGGSLTSDEASVAHFAIPIPSLAEAIEHSIRFGVSALRLGGTGAGKIR